MPDYVHEPEGIEELMPWSDKMKKLRVIDTKAMIEDKDGNPKILRWSVSALNLLNYFNLYLRT